MLRLARVSRPTWPSPLPPITGSILVGGPAPRKHNFFRRGPPSTYDVETRGCDCRFGWKIDAHGGTEVWEAAQTSTSSEYPSRLSGANDALMTSKVESAVDLQPLVQNRVTLVVIVGSPEERLENAVRAFEAEGFAEPSPSAGTLGREMSWCR